MCAVVSMNGIAVLTEMVAEKPLLNSIHGCYSLAAGVMTVMAGLLSSAGWTALPVYSVAAAVTVLCSCVAYQGAYSHEDELDITRCHNDVHHGVDEVAVVKSEQTEEHPASGDAADGGTLLNAVFLNFAGIGFLASFGEVSMTAWSVIYFQRCLGASTLKASVGFGTFMVATAIGRFGGDKMREFWGRRRLIRRCGMCLVLGFAVLLYSPSVADKETTGLIVGYFGSMLIGFGLSVLIPIVFSSAGHLPGVHAGSAIAAAAACTYTGSIVSPFFLGLCSQLLHSLREAYMIDAGLMCGVFVLSFMIPDESSKWFGATGDETEKLLVGEEEQ
jgi:Na+/melibiose symporter-like transporter